MIYNNLDNLIGNTPILKYEGVYVKLEGFNLGGSIKDRISYYILKNYIDNGLLKKGDTIVEPTSGNTGIGLSMVGAIMGINVVITMPDTMTKERINAIKAYGAKIILTDGKLGMKGAIDKANELKDKYGYILIDQFNNPLNKEAHKQTALEIINEFSHIDYFVASIGTGGTISGIALELKKKYPNIKIVGIEPEESPIITKGISGSHGIQGIGAGFIPNNLDLDLIDEVITIKTKDALNKMDELRKKGLFVGISSAANILGASKYLDKDNIVVTISPDSGLKYLSLIND